jgi:hypothetical protein
MARYINYRSFDQLLEDVSVDFGSYSLEGMIEPQQLIKVATRVNYDLGLRIHSQKEHLLEIENYKAKLPSDFYVLNFAYQCGTYEVKEPILSGTEIEERILDPGDVVLNDDDCPVDSSVCMTDCGNYYQLIQKTKFETRVYKTFGSLRIKSGSSLDPSCPNKYTGPADSAEIKDGFLRTPFKTGSVYINYQGAMEDEDGNLLVVDHPMLNEYYEYAIKQRILENMYFAGEDVVQKMTLIEQRLRAARNNALSIVNTPDFAEMRKLWEVNRKAQYHKYVNMFKSFPVIQN